MPVFSAFSDEPSSGLHFFSIDLLLSTEEAEELAAFQIELFQENENNPYQLVGVEGGNIAGFEKPPHYDLKAINGHRVILAAIKSSNDGGKINRSTSGKSTTRRLVRLHWVGSIPLKSSEEIKFKRAKFLNASGAELKTEVQIKMIQPDSAYK